MLTVNAIDAFMRSRLAKGLSTKTLLWYRATLFPFAAMFPVLPRAPETLEDFLISCRAGDERRHGYYRALKALYRFLARRYRIGNTVGLIDAPKRRAKKPRPITLDELDQLLSFPHPKRIRAALLFLADTGARVGEAARLAVADLNDTPWGKVARVDGKTGARFVPLSEGTYQLLLQTLPFGLSAARLSRLLSAAFRDARIKGTAHSLRHTFGTYWEGDEMVLQYILGHAHLSTTQVYRQLRAKRMCEQHHEFSPLRLVSFGRQMPLPFVDLGKSETPRPPGRAVDF